MVRAVRAGGFLRFIRQCRLAGQLGRIDLGGRPPRPPTDPGVHVKCTRLVTLRSIAVPHTTRSFCGDTPLRHSVLSVVPTSRPQRGTPFAPQGPEGRSPASTLLWGTATPCRPSRRSRVAPGVASQGSHRSGRADFPHPVPHLTNSLRGSDQHRWTIRALGSG
jgi:hypothetical protein